MFGGFDPGSKGGYALLTDDGQIAAVGMLPKIGKVWDWAAIAKIMAQADTVTIERVNAGAVPNRFSGFLFGEGFGGLQAIAVTLGKRLELVPPKSWQKDMLLGIPGDDTKARAMVAAMRRWPGDLEKVRALKDGPVDALLIAEWGRRARG